MSYDQREYYEPYSFQPYGALRRVWRLLYPVILFYALQGIIIGIMSVATMVPLMIDAMGGASAIADGSFKYPDYAELTPLITEATAELMMPALAVADLFALVVFGLIWRKTRTYIPRFERPEMTKTAVFGVFALLGGHALLNVLLGLLLQNPEMNESYSSVNTLLTSGSIPLRLITVAVLGPIVEEFIFRGILINRAVYWMPKWAAVVVSALIFGALHGNLIQSAYAFLAGLMFGYIYIKTRNIIACIAAHIAFNIYDQIIALLADYVTAETLGAIALTGMLVCVALGVFGAINFVKAKWAVLPANEDAEDALPP
ncbi:MAG: CPBP family intramembrane metalloprotease, partial [Oscillospiraceae bacterium]|nr:CPBP family intramembrane metalloprotease [Oscillospiraceae bacterium]